MGSLECLLTPATLLCFGFGSCETGSPGGQVDLKLTILLILSSDGITGGRLGKGF